MAQNTDKRIILYPNYIDSTVTVAQGRVLSKEQACPAPDITEMVTSAKQLGFTTATGEDKHYPRAWWVRGRLRVQIKNEDGTPVNPDIPNKRALMVKIAEHIRNNPKRPPRAFAWTAASVLASMPGPSRTSGTGEAGSSKPTGGSTNKKKNKGKK